MSNWKDAMTDDPILPPPPATVAEAMRLANLLAYGFAKHTDVAYWARYATDPVYFWRRMLGWQAGGDDVARYGLYAVPPSAWNFPGTTTTAPPVVIAPPVVLPVPPFPDLVAQLARIETKLDQLLQRPAPTFPPYSGGLFGYTLTVRPTP